MEDEWKGDYRATPTAEYLFKTHENAKVLSKKEQNKYHTITAKCLWLSQRSQVDLQLSTSYHCTRVKRLNIYDKNKLQHEIGYLWKTRYLPLIILIDGDGIAYAHIDRAHQIHDDGKGHSGLCLTMGTGSMMSVSKKLGLVTISSTETEIVSTGKRFPKCTWFRYIY